jgi:hypothetical protein
LFSSILAACGGGSGSGNGSNGGATIGATATPYIFWASQPVRPGETVLVASGNTDASSTAQIAVLDNGDSGVPTSAVDLSKLSWQSVSVVQASGTSVKLVIPASFPQGVYAVRLQANGLNSAPALLNAPDITFVQSDQGDSATPGGWIQVHGTSIAASGAVAKLDLVSQGTVVAVLSPDGSGSAYAQRFPVPSSVGTGTYQMYVHNGNGGPRAWTAYQTFIDRPITTVSVVAPSAWPATVFNVAHQPGTSDDARVAAAIAAAAANGGGVIYFPAGTYALSSQLVLPNHTVLSGAGSALSFLRWASTPTSSGAAVTALVAGAQLPGSVLDRAAFSIQDLSLTAPANYTGYAVDSEFSTEFAWLRRVTITVPKISAYNAPMLPTAVYLRHRHNVEITHSVLDAGVDLFARDDVAGLRLENNVLNWRDANISLSGLSHGFIIAGNVVNLRGTAAINGWDAVVDPNPGFDFTSFYGTPIGGPYIRDLYYAGNRSTRDEAEVPPPYVGFTYDGGQGIYRGLVASASGTTLTLQGKTLNPGAGATYDFTGAVVQIIDGTGTGQWRYLTQAGPNQSTVSVDRPWDIAPDASSTVILLNLQGRVLMIGNDFAQEQTNQDYFFAMDVIKAQNTFGVTGGVTESISWIGEHYHGLSPGWHYQVLDNTVARGTHVNLVSAVIMPVSGYSGAVGAYHVFRNNKAAASVPTTISIEALHGRFDDIVCEGNTVTDINLGARSTDPLDFNGVVLSHNTAVYDGNLIGGALQRAPGIVYVP